MAKETTDANQIGAHPFDALLELMRASSFDVMPSTIVSGMGGISEGALRARIKQGRMRPRWIYFGLRCIQVIPVKEVMAEFYPEGPDTEAADTLAFGRASDSFVPMVTESGAVSWVRVLFAGFADMGSVKRAALAEAYKHGKGRG